MSAALAISKEPELPDLVLVPPARSRHPGLVEAFEIRCWARAYLVSAGKMTLQEAVDSLQEAAVNNGLVDQLGQDCVQGKMAAAFGQAPAFAHTMPEPAPPLAPIEEPPPRLRRDLAASTIDALKYVIAQRDPEQLRRFMKHRGRDELAAMRRLLGAVT